MARNLSINYKTLRTINPEAARVAVIEYLSSNGQNVSDAARVFGVQRNVIYAILKKRQKGQLKDDKKAPKIVANKTPKEVEEKIVEIQKKHQLKVKQLWFYLHQVHGIEISYSTLRLVLKRNNLR